MTSSPPAPMPVPVPFEDTRWRSTTGLSTALVWLFGATAVASIGALVAHLNRARVISDFESFSATLTDVQNAENADNLVAAMSAIGLALLAATATVFIIWQFRSAKNNEVLGRIHPRYTSGWSIGGWFIPFANLVIPVRILQDLWQGSDLENRNYRAWDGLRRSSLIGWWWGIWTAGIVLDRVIAGMNTTTLAEIRSFDRTAAASAIVTATAAVLAIFVVRTITGRQETARAERPSSSAPVPGWYPDPMARFDHRYWDGTTWTDHVSKAGQMLNDPVTEIGELR